MSPPFSVRYEPSERDLGDAMRRRGSARTMLVIGLVGIAVVAIERSADTMAGGAIAGIVALAGAVLTFVVFLPRRARRIFREQPSAREARTVDLWDDRFETHQQTGHMAVPWADFLKWDENGRVLLLYLGSGATVALPKRIFTPAAITFVRDRLAATGLTARNRRRK